MDAKQFDRVAKAVGTRTSRRLMLLGVGGAVLSRGIAVGQVAARPACVPPGGTCTPGACCSGLCLRPTHDAPEGQCVDLATCRRGQTCPPPGQGR
jgi:hypothetical protein